MRIKAVLAGATLLAANLASALHGQGTADAERFAKIYAANNWVGSDTLPFHLKMEFELFDLDGASQAKGTIEEWWASNKSQRITIRAPWLKEDGTPLKRDDPEAVRGDYLVNQLIGAVEYPVSRQPLSGAEATNVSFGKTVLSCIEPKLAAPNGVMEKVGMLCTEPGKDALRYFSASSGMQEVTRNSIGTFRSKNVALDVRILFAGHPAINGKIIALQSLDPATVGLAADSSPKTDPPSATADASAVADSGSKPPPSSVHMAGGVIAGIRTKFVKPEYPRAAQAARLNGYVLLHAIIAKDGKIRELIPLATTNPIFTDPAMEAVRQWTYKPYLLNGEPTEVDTNITVNFSLNAGPSHAP